MASGNGVTYVGGSFSDVGPSTGGFAAIDAATGTPRLVGAHVDGEVFAAVPDGKGGFFLGGSFTTIDGVARNHLARLTASGALDTTFDPGTDNPVYALALDGSTLYVGGDFTIIGGRARNRIAALDATGAPTAFAPEADGRVRALLVSAGTIYAAGEFASIGGKRATASRR